MKIEISPDQNTVIIPDGTETKIFEFKQEETFCEDCDLDECYCFKLSDFPCIYNQRKDKQNGVFKLKQ